MDRNLQNAKLFSNKMTWMSVICAILVIMIHVCNMEVYEFSGILYWIETLISLSIAEMAVPFFFMSSAFFQFSKKRTTREVYSTKFKSLLVPYLLWNTIYLVAYFVLKQLGLTQFGVTSLNMKAILEGVFFYQSNLVFWFMYQLILLNLLYPVFRYILNKGKWISIFAFVFIIVFYEIFGEITFYRNYWIISLTSTIYFFAGAFLGTYYKNEIIASKNWKKETRYCVLLISFLICVFEFLETNIWPIHGLPTIKMFKNFALIIILFVLLDGQNDIKKCWLAQFTFMIYAMHNLILEAVEKIIYLTLPHTALIAAMDYFFAPVIVVIVIVMICLFMRKYLPGIYVILGGSRTKKV